jgi:hypothetical protein
VRAVTPPPAVAPQRPVVHHKAKRLASRKAKPKAHRSTRASPPLALTPSLIGLTPTLVRADEHDSSSSSLVVGLALSFTLGLSLVLVGLALTPLRLVPRVVRPAVYDRREPLVYTAVVVYLTTGLSLAIAIALS